MATEPTSPPEVLAQLASGDWRVVLQGVEAADTAIRSVPAGSDTGEQLTRALVAIGRHPKWEVRRAIAQLAGSSSHLAFDPVLARARSDENARVRQAAERAAARRKDWRTSGMFGRQHEAAINSTLDDIEARFGVAGREAVRRAGERVAGVFARELYHEVIKLLTPLALSAERLESNLSDERFPRASLADEARRIRSRVDRVRTTLDSMRAYSAAPELVFSREDVHETLEEAASLVRDAGGHSLCPGIELHNDSPCHADLARPRFVQAVTNVLWNAVEAYGALVDRAPIRISAAATDGALNVVVQDSGCGMSPERLAEAPLLFATNKPSGTGFGLPLAIKIVEVEHDGRLFLESQEGRGTRVNIQIPVHRVRRGN